MEVHGVPVVVVTGGRVVLEDGKLQVTQGAGRFVPTPGNNPVIYDRVRQRERVMEMGVWFCYRLFFKVQWQES